MVGVAIAAYCVEFLGRRQMWTTSLAAVVDSGAKKRLGGSLEIAFADFQESANPRWRAELPSQT